MLATGYAQSSRIPVATSAVQPANGVLSRLQDLVSMANNIRERLTSMNEVLRGTQPENGGVAPKTVTSHVVVSIDELANELAAISDLVSEQYRVLGV